MTPAAITTRIVDTVLARGAAGSTKLLVSVMYRYVMRMSLVAGLTRSPGI